MLRKSVIFLAVVLPAVWVAGTVTLVTVMKFTPVVCTPLMVLRSLENWDNPEYHISRRWVPLKSVSKSMTASAIVAEDARFLLHHGFDRKALASMKRDRRLYGSPVRGCSTISQQTAKNCFTFCSRTYFRKGVEAYFTYLIEHIWGKRRIMEVYLNVVELGPGIFGIESAAQRYYHCHASALTPSDASTIACMLPQPLARTPEIVNSRLNSHRMRIATAARSYVGVYNRSMN